VELSYRSYRRSYWSYRRSYRSYRSYRRSYRSIHQAVCTSQPVHTRPRTAGPTCTRAAAGSVRTPCRSACGCPALVPASVSLGPRLSPHPRRSDRACPRVRVARTALVPVSVSLGPRLSPRPRRSDRACPRVRVARTALVPVSACVVAVGRDVIRVPVATALVVMPPVCCRPVCSEWIARARDSRVPATGSNAIWCEWWRV